MRERKCYVAVISQKHRVHGLSLISNYLILFITQQGGADFLAGFKMKMQIVEGKTFKKTFVFTLCCCIRNVPWVTL